MASRCPRRSSSSASCPSPPPARARRTSCAPSPRSTTRRADRVPVLTSHVDPDGETYRANRAAQLALLDELGKQLEQAIAGGGERYQQRHRDRGPLLVRERIELLVDPDSPFLELSALAAWGTGFTVGASIVTGIGVISGVEWVIIPPGPAVRGGGKNPFPLRKAPRAL